VAYKAEIAVDVKGLKAVRTLESSLNKISGKISAINKISIGNSKAAKIEEKVAKSKEAQRVSMIQTRRVGDAVQRAADKGLQTEKALAAVKRAAKADAQGALKVSIEQRKIALEELKAQQQIAKVVKDKTLTGFGPKSPVFGRSTQMDSAGNTAAILQDPTTKVSPVQQALEKMEERSARNTKQAVINRKKSLSLGKDIVRIKKQEATQNARNLRSEQKQTSQAAERLKVQTANRLNASVTPRGDFSRLSDRQSRNVEGRRTFMNNPFGRMGIRPTRGFDAQSALISGGFPLLFGQGPGVAAAGALGGGIGGMFGQMGGFAGGIAATAAVTSIQNAINSIGELGKAMNRLNPNISAMSQAMGIAGTVEEKRLQLIEQNLGKQAAFNAALEMLGEKIGADQAEELRKFGETFQRLGNEVTLFFTKVQAAIAKLLNQALDAGADANLRGRARDLVAQNPNNPAFRDVNQRIKEIQARETTGRTGAKQKQDDLRAAKAERLEIAETLILEKDRDKARAQTNKLITAGLADLTKENELNKAIIAGNEEEFRIKQAVKDKVDEMGLSMKDLNDTQKQRIRDDVITNKNLKEQARIQKEIADSFKNMASTIQNDIKDGIRGLIKGTSTLGDLVNNVADRFLDMALNQALFGNVGGKDVTGGLFKFLGFARGGRPPVGKPSIVGEQGPELFVPRSSGTIVPNNKLGGGGSTSVVVNVDASGSDVQGNEAQAKELGTALSVAVRQELLKQQRPGGLLSTLR
tara:strand:+ start:26 stop:2284 length:2259 start_codon:yes stop_codon:yes gene_type:complete